MNKKLSCQDIVELVTDYIENALSAEERRRFERPSRPAPAASRTSTRSARRSASPAGCRREEPLAPALREGLLSQFRSWKRAG